MTLIIVIYTLDNHDKKEIFFASDGLVIKYEDNKEPDRYEDVEKIKKLTPEICMGYTGKNSELFEDVFDELKNKISETIKREPVAFAKKLREIIL